MRKPLIIILVAAAIIAGAGVIRLRSRPTPPTAPLTETESTADSSSRYLPYSRAAFDQAAAGRRVLYFYANWCPTCIPADKNLRANADKIPTDVTVIRVNYRDTDTDEEEKNLAKKYGVGYQHTFIQIDSQGGVITQWNGGQIEELLANIK